jgi:hypothetical protein
VSPVKYELGFYIPEDEILHSHSRENLKILHIIILLFFTLTQWIQLHSNRNKEAAVAARFCCSVYERNDRRSVILPSAVGALGSLYASLPSVRRECRQLLFRRCIEESITSSQQVLSTVTESTVTANEDPGPRVRALSGWSRVRYRA